MDYPVIESSGYYSLLWDEEEKVYHLMDTEGQSMGKLPDDTVFANQILKAFSEMQRCYKMQTRFYKLQKAFEDFKQVYQSLEVYTK